MKPFLSFVNIYLYIFIFFLVGREYIYFSFRKDIGKDIGVIGGKGKPIREPFSLKITASQLILDSLNDPLVDTLAGLLCYGLNLRKQTRVVCAYF